jgi:hypothetical protein
MKAKTLVVGGVLALARLSAGIAIVSTPFIPPAPLQAAIADLEPNCAASPYGIDGQLSEQDLRDLFYVAFPQTAQDMRGRFGSPTCFDAVADYYQVEGTTHWVAVDFSGNQAIGWRAWEVYQ